MRRDTSVNNSIIDLDLHLSRLPQKEIVTEIKRPTLQPVNVDWDNILTEWSYRLPKGYPTMKNGEFNDPKELAVLQELLLEYGVSEIPSLRMMEKEDKASVQRAPRTMDDIQQLIQNMELSPEKLSKLYNTIKTFTVYDPIKQTLLSKTPNMTVDPNASKEDQKKTKERIATKKAIYKQYTQQLKATLEELPGSALIKFQKYLQDRLDGKREPQDFPTTIGTGKFRFPKEVAEDIGKALAKHTAQDEGKKGVGQGEIMMTLIFDNITQPAGKGDVALGGKEMEVKGYNAILGKGKPDQFPLDVAWLIPYASGNEASKLTSAGWAGGTGFGKLMIQSYQQSKADGKDKMFLKAFRDALRKTTLYKNSGKIDEFINDSAFSSESVLSKRLGVLNFFVYHAEEGFGWFVAHDYGAEGGGAGNTGTYVLAGGGVDAMAETLLTNPNVTFEGITPKNIKPRIRVKA